MYVRTGTLLCEASCPYSQDCTPTLRHCLWKTRLLYDMSSDMYAWTCTHVRECILICTCMRVEAEDDLLTVLLKAKDLEKAAQPYSHHLYGHPARL